MGKHYRVNVRFWGVHYDNHYTQLVENLNDVFKWDASDCDDFAEGFPKFLSEKEYELFYGLFVKRLRYANEIVYDVEVEED